MRGLARLRWGAFGLRGRFVGAVVITTAVTLLVAATVLLPQLEHRLREASLHTLQRDVQSAKDDTDLQQVQDIPYADLAIQRNGPERKLVQAAYSRLNGAISTLTQRLGATSVALVGSIARGGCGKVVYSSPGSAGRGSTAVAGSGSSSLPSVNSCSGPYPDVRTVFLEPKKKTSYPTVYSFGTLGGTPVVQAAIWMGDDSVLAVRKSIDEIPDAVQTVREAFEIAALVAIVLTLLLAIPLAGTLVRRLQRLREAALHVAFTGTRDADAFPQDNARDEVGDLARSFRIMHRRLRQQEEARRAFVATASHELRTPLASLDGMLELLAEDLQDENLDLKDAAALLDRARSQSHRLGRLAADLLDLSRIDAEVPLRSEPLELTELVRAVLAEFEIASSERRVGAVLQDSTEQSWVLADPGSVARILRILVDNALRIAPAGSEVTVTVKPGHQPSLSVADNGPGVAADERDMIFERFKRGRETGGEAGFGLGLAIGRELAQRMSGSLELTDTAGSGATFTLTLPPAHAPTEGREPEVAQA